MVFCRHGEQVQNYLKACKENSKQRKSTENASAFRLQGNNYFKQKDDKKALDAYTKVTTGFIILKPSTLWFIIDQTS